MRRLQKSFHTCVCLGLVLAFCGLSARAQSVTGTLYGRVTDERGDVIVGVSITVVDASGVARSATTSDQGVYVFNALVAGEAAIQVEAAGFGRYEGKFVIPPRGGRHRFDVLLRVVLSEKMQIQAETSLNKLIDEKAGDAVIEGPLLDSLPDDPDDLASSLAVLSGAPARSGRMQAVVDGLASNRIPPKNLIREIRVNRNPFSAEYDRPGQLSVEIFTKPGTEKLHGEAFMSMSNPAWNSRNPFSPNPVALRSLNYGGSLSGSPMSGRLSGFLSFERRNITDDLVINATVLDQALNVSPLKQTVSTPSHFTTFSPRIDYLLGSSSTLTARYTFYDSMADNSGLTAHSFRSTSYYSSNKEQSFAATFLKVFTPKIFGDTRLLYSRAIRRRAGDDSVPTVDVLEAFTGGGAQIGPSQTEEKRWELTSNLSWARNAHTLRAGGRLRGVNIDDISRQNFGGTYLFAGGLGPVAFPAGQVPSGDAAGTALVAVTSIDRYRRTLLLQKQGLPPDLIRQYGGGASQFSITVGDPRARISQFEFGGFALDDWRLRPNLSFSFGVRVETQTNIATRFDLGPRLALVWAAGRDGKGRPNTVVRLGAGIFSDRVSEMLSLEAERYGAQTQHQFIVSDDGKTSRQVLDYFPNLPPLELLSALPDALALRRLDARIRSPHTILTGVNIERQLPRGVNLVTTYSFRRRVHDLLSININSPGPAGTRPYGDLGNIFQFESDAIFQQHQVNVQARYGSSKLMLLTSYIWSKADSNSDGPYSFPANSSNLAGEYGRTALDVRHSFSLIASLNCPLGITMSPYVTLRSGLPFNITTGSDANLDGVLTDRPAFADRGDKPGIRHTRLGPLDPNPDAGQTIIPRNFGSGPSFFQLDLRLSKTFNIASLGALAKAGSGHNSQAHTKSMTGGNGRGNTNAAPKANTAERREHKLVLSVQAFNLTNKGNLGPVVGSLSSPLFGKANSIAGGYGFGANSNPSYNRRVEMQLRYKF